MPAELQTQCVPTIVLAIPLVPEILLLPAVPLVPAVPTSTSSTTNMQSTIVSYCIVLWYMYLKIISVFHDFLYG